MLPGFRTLPAPALVYLLFAPTGLGRRIRQLVLADVAVLVSGGWSVAIAQLSPAPSRPYIAGSGNNSVLGLALGYNGLGGIFGGSGNGGGDGMGGAASTTRARRLLRPGFVALAVPSPVRPGPRCVGGLRQAADMRMPTLTWDQVLRYRYRTLVLDVPADPVGLARAVNGIQAQIWSAAGLAAWVRTGFLDETRLRAAVEVDRTLVKTWAARGTLHLLPADDLPLWCGALRTRRIVRPSWLRYHGVEAADMAAIEELLPSVLADGACLTRDELATSLSAAAGRPELRDRLLSGWGAVLKPAAVAGLLCFGPERGRNVTFVSPRTWLSSWHDVPSDDAADEVLRRMLVRFGPLTLDEAFRWSALDVPVLRRAAKRLGASGVVVDAEVEGEVRLAAAESLEALLATAPAPEVRLLPAFDPWTLVALRHLDRVLVENAHADAGKRVSRPQGWISPVVAVDGRIVATWAGDTNGVAIEPLGPLPRTLRSRLDDAAQALWRNQPTEASG